MSFNGFKSCIKEGDTVILYLSANQLHTVTATTKGLTKKGLLAENIFQTSYGAVRCGDLIGKEFGSKLQLNKGWIHILQPTPELWTLTLPHRTQIIYTPDISMIILQLEINPSSQVIESGTGSGSLSHALIRAIKPNGHLHTFDFHEARCKTAEEEFKEHGLNEFVSVLKRDVCSEGFGDHLNKRIDAVFLDLPHPWLAIPHAVKSIKEEGGRICSFSPCIEQVQKCCLALKDCGFMEIETIEVLQTQYSVQSRNVNGLDLEFLKTQKGDANDEGKQKKEVFKYLTAVPPSTQPGHTGFLSFATLPPIESK